MGYHLTLTDERDERAWLACLQAAATAISGMRSAKSLSEMADELYEEYVSRRVWRPST